MPARRPAALRFLRTSPVLIPPRWEVAEEFTSLGSCRVRPPRRSRATVQSKMCQNSEFLHGGSGRAGWLALGTGVSPGPSLRSARPGRVGPRSALRTRVSSTTGTGVLSLSRPVLDGAHAGVPEAARWDGRNTGHPGAVAGRAWLTATKGGSAGNRPATGARDLITATAGGSSLCGHCRSIGDTTPEPPNVRSPSLPHSRTPERDPEAERWGGGPHARCRVSERGAARITQGHRRGGPGGL